MSKQLRMVAFGVALASGLSLQAGGLAFADNWSVSKTTLSPNEQFTLTGPGKLRERAANDISGGRLPLGPQQYRGFCVVPENTPNNTSVWNPGTCEKDPAPGTRQFQAPSEAGNYEVRAFIIRNLGLVHEPFYRPVEGNGTVKFTVKTRAQLTNEIPSGNYFRLDQTSIESGQTLRALPLDLANQLSRGTRATLEVFKGGVPQGVVSRVRSQAVEEVEWDRGADSTPFYSRTYADPGFYSIGVYIGANLKQTLTFHVTAPTANNTGPGTSTGSGNGNGSTGGHPGNSGQSTGNTANGSGSGGTAASGGGSSTGGTTASGGGSGTGETTSTGTGSGGTTASNDHSADSGGNTLTGGVNTTGPNTSTGGGSGDGHTVTTGYAGAGPGYGHAHPVSGGGLQLNKGEFYPTEEMTVNYSGIPDSEDNLEIAVVPSTVSNENQNNYFLDSKTIVPGNGRETLDAPDHPGSYDVRSFDGEREIGRVTFTVQPDDYFLPPLNNGGLNLNRTELAPGEKFTATYSGIPNSDEILEVQIVPPGVKAGEQNGHYLDGEQVYNGSGTVQLDAPGRVGNWEVRTYMGNQVLSRVPIHVVSRSSTSTTTTTSGSQSSATASSTVSHSGGGSGSLRLEQTTLGEDQSFYVNVTTGVPQGETQYWVMMVPADAPHGSLNVALPVRTEHHSMPIDSPRAYSGPVEFTSPRESGTYELRLYYGDRELSAVPVSVQ